VFDTKLVVPLEAHILTVGGQWWEGEMKDGVVSDTLEQTQWALFVEDEWQVLDRVGGCNKFCVLSHATDPRRGTWQDAPNRRLMMS